jgi:gamma-glutamylcyclotransferase (GGCT)/AIG2-like uncharacterized protein YtfP
MTDCLKGGGKMTTQLYFAYGSNLNINDFEQWCLSRGYPAGLLTPVGRASLRDFELAFGYRSSSRRGGVLDIREQRGSVVSGVIIEVDSQGWEALDQKEGVAAGCYQREEVVVFDEDGKMRRATTYRVVESLAQEYVVPAPGYVKVVQHGLEKSGISDAHLLAAAKNDRLPCPDGIFVYGTLMRGESRFEVLKRFGIECSLLAEAQGQLFDLGLFPGMTRDRASESHVHGEFIRLRNPETALATLDRIEGFRGFGNPGSLYRRELIPVHVGDGRIRTAWTYCMDASADDAPVILSGDWRKHCGTQERFMKWLANAHSGQHPRRIAERLASKSPYNWSGDRTATVEGLLPVDDALVSGTLSERKLAQATGKWAVIP